MTIHRPRTNPLHHNAGRVPNFNQNLTRHLSFVNFTCKGLMGNLSSAWRLLDSTLRERNFYDLPANEKQQITNFIKRIKNLCAELQELADDVAEFNRDKTKLALGPTQKRKIYPPP